MSDGAPVINIVLGGPVMSKLKSRLSGLPGTLGLGSAMRAGRWEPRDPTLSYNIIHVIIIIILSPQSQLLRLRGAEGR